MKRTEPVHHELSLKGASIKNVKIIIVSSVVAKVPIRDHPLDHPHLKHLQFGHQHLKPP